MRYTISLPKYTYIALKVYYKINIIRIITNDLLTRQNIMRKPNFTNLSTEILNNYKSEIDLILKDRKSEDDKKNKLMKKVQALADAEGISIESLLGGEPTGKIKKTTPTGRPVKKVKPKYANLKDPSQTWTGRGRQPLWVSSYLSKKGKKIEDLAI